MCSGHPHLPGERWDAQTRHPHPPSRTGPEDRARPQPAAPRPPRGACPTRPLPHRPPAGSPVGCACAVTYPHARQLPAAVSGAGRGASVPRQRQRAYYSRRGRWHEPQRVCVIYPSTFPSPMRVTEKGPGRCRCAGVCATPGHWAGDPALSHSTANRSAPPPGGRSLSPAPNATLRSAQDTASPSTEHVQTSTHGPEPGHRPRAAAGRSAVPQVPGGGG